METDAIALIALMALFQSTFALMLFTYIYQLLKKKQQVNNNSSLFLNEDEYQCETLLNQEVKNQMQENFEQDEKLQALQSDIQAMKNNVNNKISETITRIEELKGQIQDKVRKLDQKIDQILNDYQLFSIQPQQKLNDIIQKSENFSEKFTEQHKQLRQLPLEINAQITNDKISQNALEQINILPQIPPVIILQQPQRGKDVTQIIEKIQLKNDKPFNSDMENQSFPFNLQMLRNDFAAQLWSQKDLYNKLEETNTKQFKQIKDLIYSKVSEFDSEFKKIKQQLNIGEENQKNDQNLVRKKRVQDIIKKLYEVTNQQRYVERQFKYFVRDEQNLNELYRNYSIRSSDMKNKLSQICSSFRQARGDGNCFYTSFGFQYLLIILLKYSDQEFNQFIEELKTKQIPMKIRLIKDDEFNNEEEQQLLLDEFLYRLQQLRKIENLQIRENTFIEHFKEFEEINNENDGCLYGLSTIFFRNIADLAVESHEFKSNIFDRFNLLIWEVECYSNEIVIDSLANYFKINVKLLFFDYGKFIEKHYKPENKNQIILLIRPGHYNIGLLKQQEFQEAQGQNILVQDGSSAQQIVNTNNFQQNQNENQQIY